jgi:hypothetical protein
VPCCANVLIRGDAVESLVVQPPMRSVQEAHEILQGIALVEPSDHGHVDRPAFPMDDAGEDIAIREAMAWIPRPNRADAAPRLSAVQTPRQSCNGGATESRRR